MANNKLSYGVFATHPEPSATARSGCWSTLKGPSSDAADVTLIITREEHLLRHSLGQYPGLAQGTICEDFTDAAILAAQSNHVRLLVDRDDISDQFEVLNMARQLTIDGPVLLLTARPLVDYVLFRAIELGITVLRRWDALQTPQTLGRLLSGLWPDCRQLHTYCVRHRLSPTETRALLAACAGLPKIRAAEELGCSIRTLESHWSRIFAKVGIRSTDGVLAAALRDTLCGGSSVPVIVPGY